MTNNMYLWLTEVILLKEELHLKPKFSMFCVPPKKYQHLLENNVKYPKADCVRN